MFAHPTLHHPLFPLTQFLAPVALLIHNCLLTLPLLAESAHFKALLQHTGTLMLLFPAGQTLTAPALYKNSCNFNLHLLAERGYIKAPFPQSHGTDTTIGVTSSYDYVPAVSAHLLAPSPGSFGELGLVSKTGARIPPLLPATAITMCLRLTDGWFLTF